MTVTYRWNNVCVSPSRQRTLLLSIKSKVYNWLKNIVTPGKHQASRNFSNEYGKMHIRDHVEGHLSSERR